LPKYIAAYNGWRFGKDWELTTYDKAICRRTIMCVFIVVSIHQFALRPHGGLCYGMLRKSYTNNLRKSIPFNASSFHGDGHNRHKLLALTLITFFLKLFVLGLLLAMTVFYRQSFFCEWILFKTADGLLTVSGRSSKNASINSTPLFDSKSSQYNTILRRNTHNQTSVPTRAN
jgi:hypothetical protein